MIRNYSTVLLIHKRAIIKEWVCFARQKALLTQSLLYCRKSLAFNKKGYTLSFDFK
jgi:hypothetical protein